MIDRDIVLVASGDSRLAANRVCWPAQARARGRRSRLRSPTSAPRVVRGHPVDAAAGHGFIDGQIRGIEVFRQIDPEAPLVVAEAVWQYTSHVLPGLTRHRGPILTLANWSGQWPGLVGMLNLNGSLTKAGIRYSTIWSEDVHRSRSPATGSPPGSAMASITHRHATVTRFDPAAVADAFGPDVARGSQLGGDLRRDQAVLGVFDEGCMGMFNAIIPDLCCTGSGSSRSA